MHSNYTDEHRLAVIGGSPCVKAPHPHEVWPPPPSPEELNELCEQRKRDISIKGRTGIIKELEDLFISFLDNKVRYAITFNSGTSALLAAYFALGVNDGDEVIGPALTFHAVLSPAYLLKASIILVDIDRKTRCIDPFKIEKAITDRTRVLTVVHQWGHPADMDRIVALVEKYNLKLIEDCSHAHGSKYRGRLCGTFGNAAVFSFQAAKMIFAGEGGILVTSFQDIHDRATLLGHYRDRSKEEIENPVLQRYWATGFGQKFRMSSLNAVVAKHALLNYQRFKEGRHRCLSYFNEQIGKISYLESHYVDLEMDMGAWYGFKPLYFPERLNDIPIDLFVKVLQAEGMEIDRASAPVLSTQPLYNLSPDDMFSFRQGKYMNSIAATPIANYVQEHSLSLPTFYDWNHDRAIIDQYIAAFEKMEKLASSLSLKTKEELYV